MEIIRGKKKKPFNVMLLGTPGIGKSTWAASCPSPIFITAEEIDELDAARLPQLTKFDQIFEALDFVKKHDEFKTVVIDTIDSARKAFAPEDS
jgi:septin family protein